MTSHIIYICNKVYCVNFLPGGVSLNYRFGALGLSRSGCGYIGALTRYPHHGLLHTSAIMYAEPMKKKKRVDPAVLIAREQRARRRLEKAVRRLEKAQRKLKPIDEIIGDYKLQREKNTRKRKPESFTPEQNTLEAQLLKQWTKYTMQQHRQEMASINSAQRSTERALSELKKVSPTLYDAAVQPDLKCLPFERIGPTLTPPVVGYQSPDGDYQDVTKSFEFPLIGNTTSILRNLVPFRRRR